MSDIKPGDTVYVKAYLVRTSKKKGKSIVKLRTGQIQQYTKTKGIEVMSEDVYILPSSTE